MLKIPFFYIIHSVANSGKFLQVISQISFPYMVHTTGSSSSMGYLGIACVWYVGSLGKTFDWMLGIVFEPPPPFWQEKNYPILKIKPHPVNPKSRFFLEKVKNSDLNIGYGL